MIVNINDAVEIIADIKRYEQKMIDTYEGMMIRSYAQLDALSEHHTNELNNRLKNDYNIREDIAHVIISRMLGIKVTVMLGLDSIFLNWEGKVK